MNERLPTLSSADLITLLERAGFVVDHQTGSHAVLYNQTTEKRAVVPMHPGDLPRPLMKAIFKQAGLTEDEARDLL